MKFFKGFLVFILVAVIIGGVGYIGYTFLFMGGMDHSGGTSAAHTQQPADTKSNTDQSQQNTQGMQNSSLNNQPQQNGQSQQNSNQQPLNSQIALNRSNEILQSKEKLNKSIALLNEAFRLMTVDPYAPQSNDTGTINGMSNTLTQQQAANQTQPVQSNTSAVTTPGNNTTINIFPQGSNSMLQQGAVSQMNAIQSMGTTYDANKMDQLHAGLYKIAVGKSLLEQLDAELASQAGYAAGNAEDLVQYFTNQYNLTVQNKNKLNQALTYINEAADLVNINPYVSATGLVYDKDRMSELHKSIQKLAEGVVSLNQLNDDFANETILLSNTVQNYINNAYYLNNQQMNHANMSTGLFGGLFGNIGIGSIVNIVLILFVFGLVAGIFGFAYSLVKSSAQRSNSKDNGI